jgi:hypothetical protein
MRAIAPLEPIEYLIIGHIAYDLTPNGPRLGGTAAYAALTAQSLGLRVGVVTSWGEELPLGPLLDIPIVNVFIDKSTTFENINTPKGRLQILHHCAHTLDYYHIPETWRDPTIIHLGPIAQEVEPSLIRRFPNSLRGVTPQGWLRTWDSSGKVKSCEWPEAAFVLEQSDASVISIEDVDGDEHRIEEMAIASRIFAVTEGAAGARVFWNGDVRRIHAPEVEEVDPTGSGDIFAAAFFIRLHKTHDPWESARFANQLAAQSVTRPGLSGIPEAEQVQLASIEVL